MTLKQAAHHEESISIVLGDPHELVLDGLERILLDQRGVNVVGRCTDARSAVDLITELRPRIAILDLRLPTVGAIGVARELKRRHVATTLVLLASELGDHEFLEAIRAGFAGVVLKEMPAKLLIQCIRKVASGESWVERKSAARFFASRTRVDEVARGRQSVLTDRELDIVRLAASGLRNREIAKRLFIAESTAKNHLHAIYEKTGVQSRFGLIQYAREHELI